MLQKGTGSSASTERMKTLTDKILRKDITKGEYIGEEGRVKGKVRKVKKIVKYGKDNDKKKVIYKTKTKGKLKSDKLKKVITPENIKHKRPFKPTYTAPSTGISGALEKGETYYDTKYGIEKKEK